MYVPHYQFHLEHQTSLPESEALQGERGAERDVCEREKEREGEKGRLGNKRSKSTNQR